MAARSDDTKIKMYGEYFNDGMGWGDLKKMLFDIIDSELGPYRDKYEKLISKPSLIEEVLTEGEKKAVSYTHLTLPTNREV